MRYMRVLCLIFLFFAVPASFAFAQDRPTPVAGYDCLVHSDAGCLYKILAKRVLNEPTDREAAYKIAETLVKRGEYELAEAFVYRRLAEIDETHTYPQGPFNEGMLLLAQIKKKRGEDEAATRLFKVAIPKSGMGFSLDNLGDNPAERIMLLQNAVSNFEKKVFTPDRHDASLESLAQNGISLAESLENLALEYSRQGLFTEARETIAKINKDYIFRGGRKDYPFADIFDIDSFSRFQYLLKDTERGGRGTAFLGIVFEWAVREVEKGNKDFADKALIFAESMLTGTYTTDAPYREVKRYVNASPEEKEALLARFYALAGREQNLRPYFGNLSQYINQMHFPNVMRALLVRGNIELAVQIAELPGANKVEAYKLILTALYKRGDRAELRRVMEKSLRETARLPKDHIAEIMKENARLAYLIGDKVHGKKMALAALAADPFQRDGATDLTCASSGGGFCRVYTPAPEAVKLLMHNDEVELAKSFLGNSLGISVALAEGGFYDEALLVYASAIQNARGIETAGWWIAYHIARSEKRDAYRDDFERLVKPFEQMPYTRKAMWLPTRAQMSIGLELMRSRMEGRNPDMNAIALPLQLANIGINALPAIDKYCDELGFPDFKSDIWQAYLVRFTENVYGVHGVPYAAIILNLLDAGRTEEAQRLMMAFLNPVYFVSEFGSEAQFSARKDSALLGLYEAMAQKGRFEELGALESLTENASILTDMRFQRARALLARGARADAEAALKQLPGNDADLHGLIQRLGTENKPHGLSYAPVLDVAERLMQRVATMEALGRSAKDYEGAVENIRRWMGHPGWKYKLSLTLAVQTHAAGQVDRSHAFARQALLDLRDGQDYVSYSSYKKIIEVQRAVGDDEGLKETTRYILDWFSRSKKTSVADFLAIVDTLVVGAEPVPEETREEIIFLLRTGENLNKYVAGRVAGGRPPCAVPKLDKEAFQVHMVTTQEGLDSFNLNLFFWQKVFLSSRVRVEAGSSPIVLVLNATMTHSWKLDVAEGANLAAIIVGGMNTDVSGVPKGVPVISVSNWGNKKLPNCNRVVFFSGDIDSGGAQKLFAALDTVQELVGRPVDHLYWRPEPGGYFLVRPLTQEQLDKKAVYKKLARGSHPSATQGNGQRNYILRGRQVAEAIASGAPLRNHGGKPIGELTGRQGIARLAHDGYLRRADKDDIALLDAWLEGASARFKMLNEDFEFGNVPKKIDYIVMKPLVFPAPDGSSSLDGISFFVPGGIGPDLANDNYLQYKVYYMEGFSCKNVPQMRCDY